MAGTSALLVGACLAGTTSGMADDAKAPAAPTATPPESGKPADVSDLENWIEVGMGGNCRGLEFQSDRHAGLDQDLSVKFLSLGLLGRGGFGKRDRLDLAARRIFVNRGTLVGKPVNELAASFGVAPGELPFHPAVREKLYGIYDNDNRSRTLKAGKLDAIVNHMGNFFDCVKSRRPPISDVVSQHRSASTCHLANIAIRLGRKLQWDPEKECFLGDAEANAWLRRQQRAGYEIEGD